jgi:fluoride exporter
MSGVLTWCAVGLLGGCGALARFLLDGIVSERGAAGRFPLGTLAVNLSGSVLLGLLAGATLHGDALLLAGTATLGSYTTFSTWMFESHRLAEDGEWPVLAANVAGSLALGLAGVALGRLIGGAL